MAVDYIWDTTASERATAVGNSASNQATLLQWAAGENYELTAITYDADNVPTTATIRWPDGAAGVMTTTSKNATWLAVDAYTLTHANFLLTVTQTAVTRNAAGSITIKPALTVA